MAKTTMKAKKTMKATKPMPCTMPPMKSRSLGGFLVCPIVSYRVIRIPYPLYPVNILSDILSDMLSDILSDTLSNMMDGWPAGYPWMDAWLPGGRRTARTADGRTADGRAAAARHPSMDSQLVGYWIGY